MNERINLDDSVLGPKGPLSVEPAADTEGHLFRGPQPDDSEDTLKLDTEGHVRTPWADGTEAGTSPADDTEGHLWL